MALAGGRVAAVDRRHPGRTPPARWSTRAASSCVPGLSWTSTPTLCAADVLGDRPLRRGVAHAPDDVARRGLGRGLTLAGFREWAAERVRVRVRALLNISSIGACGPESSRTSSTSTRTCARRLVERNRDLVFGVKARPMGSPTVGAALEPLRRVLPVADACGTLLMVHVAHGPPSIQEVVAPPRSGDVLTHCSTGVLHARGRRRQAA